MKTILRRNDNTSIFCPARCKHRSNVSLKTKTIEVTIACALIVVGLSMILFTR